MTKHKFRNRRLIAITLLTALLTGALAGVGFAQALAPETFLCTGDPFIVFDHASQLNQIDLNLLGSTFTFDSIASPINGLQINNLGYRSTDNLLYGWERNAADNGGRIVQIDSAGNVTGLGNPGLPANQGDAYNYNAGDVSVDGSQFFLSYSVSNGAGGVLYVVDLPALTLSTVTITVDSGNVADWAAHPTNGLLYGGDQTDWELAVLNPVTGVRTDMNIGLPNEGSLGYGAAWFDASGRLFLYHNSGKIYAVDNVGTVPTLVGDPYPLINLALNTTNNDGANCAAGEPPVEIADLRLEKSVDNASPNVGENVVFTVVVTNDGPSDATGVTVSDILPSGYTYVSDDQGDDLADDTWDIASLANGVSATLNITAEVQASGDYTNYAQVATSDQDDPDSTPGDNLDTDDLDDGIVDDDEDSALVAPVPIADLSLTKSVDDASPNVGENVVFTVVVTNDGPSDATGVTVSDILPSGYTYVSDDQGDDLADDTWDIGALAKDASATLNITATVLASGEYSNYAQVATSDQDDPDSTPGDNLDTDDLDDGIVDDDEDSALVAPVPIADLSLTKSVDDASPNVGENVVFTVVVTNDGPSDATGVTVSDVLPSGYSYVSDDQGDDLADDTWDIGALANGVSATLNITAEVQASGDYTNYAQVASSDQADPDSTPGDNLDTDDLDDGIVDDDEDSALVAPVPIADLSLTKSVDNASPNVGENVVFTVVVTNDGPSDATGVTVSDVLPSGYTYVSDDQGDDLADDTWDIGSLAKDASATLNITATVLASGEYSNYAQVATSDQKDPDSTPGDGSVDQDDDDTAAVSPNLRSNPAIDIEKYVSVDGQQTWDDADVAPGPQVISGQDVYFKFVITNSGDVTLTALLLSDSDFDLSGFTLAASLEPGESVTIIAGPFAAELGQHENTATATGVYNGQQVLDQDKAYYAGKYWAFTPGFWKSSTRDKGNAGHDAWKYTAYTTDQVLSDVFDATFLQEEVRKNKVLAQFELLEALNFKGGEDLGGAKEILLRAAVASLLNASFHEEMGNDIGEDGVFPYTSAEIIEKVNTALASGDRDTILTLATELDEINNGIHYIDWNWPAP